jgi:antagonist of KipI
MSLSIIKAGICDTFQDEGRNGLQHLGINPGGAMDRFAMHAANLLVGNDCGTAILEMHFPAATILLERTCLIVIAGANFSPEIDGTAIQLLQPIWIPAGSTLQFKQVQQGTCCYLAIHGSFALEPWIDSCSTQIKLGVGGWKGRALQKQDRIPLAFPDIVRSIFPGMLPKALPWKAMPWQDPAPANEIWIVEGPEIGLLDEQSNTSLEYDSFTMLPASDRMAYSLKGPALSMIGNEQLVSSAVVFGTLQLLPDGQLMALMADHQTTGGYPRVGQVIQAHLSKLAQCRPGERIRFRIVSADEAQQLWLQQYRHLKLLEYASRFKLESLKLQA